MVHTGVVICPWVYNPLELSIRALRQLLQFLHPAARVEAQPLLDIAQESPQPSLFR